MPGLEPGAGARQQACSRARRPVQAVPGPIQGRLAQSTGWDLSQPLPYRSMPEWVGRAGAGSWPGGVFLFACVGYERVEPRGQEAEIQTCVGLQVL